MYSSLINSKVIYLNELQCYLGLCQLGNLSGDPMNIVVKFPNLCARIFKTLIRSIHLDLIKSTCESKLSRNQDHWRNRREYMALSNKTPFAIEFEREIRNVTEKLLSIGRAHLRLYKVGRILSLDSILSTLCSSRRPDSQSKKCEILRKSLTHSNIKRGTFKLGHFVEYSIVPIFVKG
ncbi:hypothetical protein BpHYR1_045314 [Brachionus plicatilis]|uniref:Uncharacterized protein n=1 Tax=Brachionus plicatilis TaxID=10195 RepID=A0A3M7PI22_BRAPC|nr:hypothetical protein BpHYR1_045314 [Brachionus plicatilis]